VTLYKGNASTLTPDPIHSAFYDRTRHPHASRGWPELRRTHFERHAQ